MKNTRSWVVVAALALVGLSGCARGGLTYLSSVSTFHKFGATSNKYAFAGEQAALNYLYGKTFNVVHPDKEINESLEFDSYAQRVGRRLVARGLRWNKDNPDLLVTLTYAMDGGTEKMDTEPVYEETGKVISASHILLGRTRPGERRKTQVGSRTYTYTVFQRELALAIIEINPGKDKENKKIFEGKVSSTGSSGQFASILPYMIGSLFANFPGANGQVKTIRLREGDLLEQQGSW